MANDTKLEATFLMRRPAARVGSDTLDRAPTVTVASVPPRARKRRKTEAPWIRAVAFGVLAVDLLLLGVVLIL